MRLCITWSRGVESCSPGWCTPNSTAQQGDIQMTSNNLLHNWCWTPWTWSTSHEATC